MYDLVIKNVRVVQPDNEGTFHADIAISNGKIEQIASSIPADQALQSYDGNGQLAFPGL
ncbi:MAG: hydantoinase, partial [Bacteroidota bacterium]